MPKLILLFGGLIFILITLIVIAGSLSHKKPSNTNNNPGLNIPVSSNNPTSSGPSLDSSPSAVQNAQTLSFISTSPKDGDINVPVNSPIIFTFNRNVDSSGAVVKFNPDAQFSLSSDANSLTVTPTSGLSPSTFYQVQVSLPGVGFNSSISFTTVIPSPTPSPSATPLPTSTP